MLCPGLRVGYVRAAPALSAALVRIKQATDLHTGTFSQRLAHRLVTTPGFFPGHLAALPGRYRARADALTGALRAELGGRLAFAEPDGGMCVWARVTGPAVDTTALLARALDAGVAFVPGRAFAVADRPGGTGAGAHADHLRLSFATPQPDELREAARRLAVAAGAG